MATDAGPAKVRQGAERGAVGHAAAAPEDVAERRAEEAERPEERRAQGVDRVAVPVGAPRVAVQACKRGNTITLFCSDPDVKACLLQADVFDFSVFVCGYSVIIAGSKVRIVFCCFRDFMVGFSKVVLVVSELIRIAEFNLKINEFDWLNVFLIFHLVKRTRDFFILLISWKKVLAWNPVGIGANSKAERKKGANSRARNCSHVASGK